jgi:hypothetical protein
MSTLIVTLAGTFNDLPDEDIEGIREDCEDVLRGMGVSGVTVEVEVLR